MTTTTHLSRTETVARIRQLIREKGRINWEIGDLVLDQTPEPDGTALADLASDVGIELATLAERRSVSQRTPPAMRHPGVSWSVYKEIASLPDPDKRAELQQYVLDTPVPPGYKSWTVSLMREKVGRRPMLHTAEPLLPHVAASSFEEKVAAAGALMADPAVATEYHRRMIEEDRDRERDTERRDNADPVIRKLNEMQAVQDLTGVYADAATRATELLRVIVALPKAGDDPLADRVFLREAIDRLTATIEATEDLLAGRAQGVDDFFARVLKEAKG